MIAVFTWVQVPPGLLHTLGSTVCVVPVELSVSVAVAQSYVSVSGHTLRYQNDSVLEPVGAVNVWAIELSPLVGLVNPSIAAYVPECGVAVVTDALPAVVVHPLRLPVSNVPFWKVFETGAVIATSS